MKKSAIVFFISIFGIASSKAQDINAGFKVEAGISNFIMSHTYDVESKAKFGTSFGGFMKIDICEHFAVQPELLLRYKSSEIRSSEGTSDFECWGVDMPVYAMGSLNAGKGMFYAGIGPYIGCGFGAKFKMSDIDLYEDEYLRRLDFGGGAMIGYEFGFGLQINAGYKIGVVNMLDIEGKAKMLPQTVNLGIGFRF